MLERITPRLAAYCTPRDADLFRLRLERYADDFYIPLQRLYGQRPDFEQHITQLIDQLLRAYVSRPADLRLLDLRRQLAPDWFQRETMVGYVCYVDRFATTLNGVAQQLDYLQELGVNYLHLMPLLQPRAGLNDGGYAVNDYRAVNADLGTMGDLAALASALRQRNMSLCIDLVLNHTAKEHEWALRAMAGEAEYMNYYFTFPDRTMPDAYERTVREIFPDFKPGSFTFYPQMTTTGRWVWTTFNEFQWDLNYTNPAVFRAMADVMFYLANQGIEVLRLDAVPFLWKRLDTDCENQPEAHLILQAFRGVMRVVAPALIFKAEAIVSPNDLIPYLGVGSATGKECELAYNNQLMVLLWSSLATRKVTLLTHTLQQMPPTPPGTTWVTYVRCHDDIGWAVTDEHAAAVGENGFWHRQFLNAFYSGAFAGSFARGAIFQYNPVTRDGRISGSAAALAGLEDALEAKEARTIDQAIRRVLMLYSIIMVYGGIPLIYMGDELGLLNDYSYTNDPLHTDDNRWLHRPPMDWQRAAERHAVRSVAGRLFNGMRHLTRVRRQTAQLHGAGQAQPLWTDNPHIFALVRTHPVGRLLLLANFHDYEQSVACDIIWQAGLRGEIYNLLDPTGRPLDLYLPRLRLAGAECLWLVGTQG